MTSARQIEANRRNAKASTGPKTNLGKQRASQNAVRHGLTAETVLVPLEDAADYQAFEQAVTADYEAETAVQTDWTGWSQGAQGNRSSAPMQLPQLACDFLFPRFLRPGLSKARTPGPPPFSSMNSTPVYFPI